MLSSFKFLISSADQPRHPSVILIIGPASTTASVLHVVPETQIAEHFSYSCEKGMSFSYAGAVERSREQLGTVRLYIGDGETTSTLLGEISARVVQALNSREKQDIKGTPVDILREMLRSEVSKSLQCRRGREPSMNATQEYPIFIALVDRPRPGHMLDLDTQLTSFPR